MDQIQSWTELYITEQNSYLGSTIKTPMLRWSMYFHVHVCADLNESISTCLCLGKHDLIQSWTELYKTEPNSWLGITVRRLMLRWSVYVLGTFLSWSKWKYEHMPVLQKTWSDTIMNRTVQNWTKQLVRYLHENTYVKMIFVCPCTCLCWSQWKY